ncbi:MAG: hypothetical protein P1P90_04375 [Patescibacteria group bacterium]|nr:hypothetical protein [Patescibacteria group bacterium]
MSSKTKKTQSYNIQHLHSWLFGLAVLTILAVGVPVVLWAQSNDAPHRVSVDAGALSQLQMKLADLQQSLDSLMASKTEIGEPALGFVTMPDDFRADCLNQCREQQVSCFDEYEGTEPFGLHPCLSQSSACITSCNDAPRAPVSCQDRCAVALGGCVESVVAPKGTVVADEQAALDVCRMQNVECLINACNLSNEAAMPDTYCTDQCRRLNVICSTGSTQYDVNAMELCKRMEQTCNQRLCARVGLFPGVKIMQTDDGTYFADQNGKALYTYAKDAKGVSECAGACLDNWPMFYVEDLMLGNDLNKEDFDSILREDGNMQLTYKGWPLYYYAGDQIQGDTNGNMKNNEWYLANSETRALSRDVCEASCDMDFEECKRSDEMPFTCQQKMESCRISCFDFSTN